jgi:hypothetical protein
MYYFENLQMKLFCLLNNVILFSLTFFGYCDKFILCKKNKLQDGYTTTKCGHNSPIFIH